MNIIHNTYMWRTPLRWAWPRTNFRGLRIFCLRDSRRVGETVQTCLESKSALREVSGNSSCLIIA
jgi:hypothetical protein